MKKPVCVAALLVVLLSACAAKPEQTPTTVAATVTTRAAVATAYGPDIYDINQSIDQAHLDSVGARVLSKELMTYSDFLAEFERDHGRDFSIADDQRVWVVRVFFPAFDTIRGGVFKNATTISLYDAETGFYYGYSVNGDEVLD